jgi:cytochrome c oxidase subunit 4
VEEKQNIQLDSTPNEHIVSFRDNLSTWLALIILTVLTISIAVFSVNLVSLTSFTALTIASTKALVVAYYFMHLKFDSKVYRRMIYLVIVLYAVFMILIIIDYLNR